MKNNIDNKKVEKIIKGFIEVELVGDSFLKVQETLSRIGIASYTKEEIYQSCHILYKRGKYYIVHFKEMFLLDGKQSTFDSNDLLIRNKIATLLEEWGLVKIVDPSNRVSSNVKINNLKILKYSNKGNWKLKTKYNIGNVKGYKNRKESDKI